MNPPCFSRGESSKQKLFHTFDIILTAALIAGGSSGIDRLASVYESFTGSAALQAQQSTNSQQAVANSKP